MPRKIKADVEIHFQPFWSRYSFFQRLQWVVLYSQHLTFVQIKARMRFASYLCRRLIKLNSTPFLYSSYQSRAWDIWSFMYYGKPWSAALRSIFIEMYCLLLKYRCFKRIIFTKNIKVMRGQQILKTVHTNGETLPYVTDWWNGYHL